MNKVELEKKIRELEELTNEEKSALVELLRRQKKYGLVWEDKPEDVEKRLQEELPVLTEVKERAIISDDKDAPNHILIEGDNLEALTALTYTHAGKIDVIYIDPPYNTGNKDFIYNDRFVDSEDSFRHSKWLSFMDKRLRIAKNLLSDKGVIFISIDDNEQAQLKLLCDEIFGSQNFIAKFDWRKKTGANDAKDIAVVTESILLYSKNRITTINEDLWSRDEDSINHKRYKYEDKYVKERGMFYYDTLDRGGLQYSDSMNFGITAPDCGILYPNGRSTFVKDGWIWKWGKEKVQWGIDNGFLEFVKSNKSSGSSYTIKYKVYKNVDNEGKVRTKSGRAYTNLIIDPINQQGNSELKDVFDGNCSFSNPKPIGLIGYLLKTIKSNNINILDFFAGSGTTLHATMQLNSEDGGHRQCILVTNNENNICEQVTYERNKRVIQGYTNVKGEEVAGLTANNLRYYKTDFISRKRTIKNMRALVTASTDLLCIKNNVYTEQPTFANRKLKPKVARYFDDDKIKMLVIYNELAVDAFAKTLRTMNVDSKIKVYVFSNNRYAYTDNFEEVLDKVELCALPTAIYDAYNSVLKPYKKEETDATVVFEDDSTETTHEQGTINFNKEGGEQ
jgi:adenine-specific DNA-methyltransferase